MPARLDGTGSSDVSMLHDEQKRHLADCIRAGDTETWEQFIRDRFRTVAGFNAAIVQDSELAGQLTSLTFLRALENVNSLSASEHDVTTWLLFQAKDVCFDKLQSELHQKTVFQRSQEIFSTPPALRAIPSPLMDSDQQLSKDILETIYDEIIPEHQLFFELSFVEQVPQEAIARLFGVSANLLTSFLFSVISTLADLDSLRHSTDCRPDLFLCMSTIEHINDSAALRKLMEEVSECASCRRLIFRTMRLVALFATDTRPLIAPDDAVIQELTPRRRKAKKGKISTFAPIPMRHRHKEHSFLVRTLAPALILAAFVWGVFTLFEGNLVDALASRQTIPQRMARAIAEPGTASRLPAVIGTLYGLSGGRTPLFAGQEVATDAQGPSTIEFEDDCTLLISPSSTLVVRPRKAILVRGALSAQLPEGLSAPFTVYTREAEIASQHRLFHVFTAPGRGTRIGVSSGEAVARLPDGTEIPIPQDHTLVIKPTGRFKLSGGVDTPTEDCVDETTSTQVDELRRERLVSLRGRVRNRIHRSPDIAPPIPRGRNSPDPNNQRNYRDYY